MRQGLAVDKQVAHLDPAEIEAGDQVIGSLPVHLAAEVCARGARYYHLQIELPPELRGNELTAEQMEQCGAELKLYRVVKETI